MMDQFGRITLCYLTTYGWVGVENKSWPPHLEPKWQVSVAIVPQQNLIMLLPFCFQDNDVPLYVVSHPTHPSTHCFYRCWVCSSVHSSSTNIHFVGGLGMMDQFGRITLCYLSASARLANISDKWSPWALQRSYRQPCRSSSHMKSSRCRVVRIGAGMRCSALLSTSARQWASVVLFLLHLVCYATSPVGPWACSRLIVLLPSASLSPLSIPTRFLVVPPGLSGCWSARSLVCCGWPCWNSPTHWRVWTVELHPHTVGWCLSATGPEMRLGSLTSLCECTERLVECPVTPLPNSVLQLFKTWCLLAGLPDLSTQM